MKKALNFLTFALCIFSFTSCDEDFSSYPPQFGDMVFNNDNAVVCDTVTAGQSFNATLSMATEQQNTMLSSPPAWTLDKDVQPTSTSIINGLLPTATFTVPTTMSEGLHDVKVQLTYGVMGNESKEMKDYKTATGLSVKYFQPWAGTVGHYVFTCTKQIYIKALPEVPNTGAE